MLTSTLATQNGMVNRWSWSQLPQLGRAKGQVILRLAEVTIQGRAEKVRRMDKGSRQWKDMEVREEGGVLRVSLEIDKGDLELLEVVRE